MELSALYEKLQFKPKHHNKLADYIADGCLYILSESPINPLLFQPSASSIISRLSISDDHFIRFGSELLQPFYDIANEQGLIRDGVSLNQMVEWITRFIISFIANPSPQFKNKKQQRMMVRNFLVPSLLIEDR